MHHALFRFVAAAARQGRFGCGPRHRSSDSVIRIMIFAGGGNSVQRVGRPAQCGRSRVWRSNVRACCEFGHPDAEHAERGAEHAEKITPNRRKPLLWALCAPLGVLCVKGGITSERRRRRFGNAQKLSLRLGARIPGRWSCPPAGLIVCVGSAIKRTRSNAVLARSFSEERIGRFARMVRRFRPSDAGCDRFSRMERGYLLVSSVRATGRSHLKPRPRE
jgi:hypothetical protein